MFELSAKLNELQTFQTLVEVEAELERVKTPKNFDPNNPEHLLKQLERLRKREGLDQAAAISAFRLEVATSTDSLLTPTERLATVASYDPEVVERHVNNHNRVSGELKLSGKHGAGLEFARRKLQRARLLGAEGWGVPDRTTNAVSLTENITTAHDFATAYAGETVAVKLSHDRTIIGVLPSASESFAIAEPSVLNGVIEYHTPSSFDGISGLRLFTENGETALTPGRYPNVIRERDGELVANPQLSRLRQNLGLLGVNIYRLLHKDDFTSSIVPESKGWKHIFPVTDAERYRRPMRHVQSRRTYRHTYLR